jgi:hypothetical protein
MSAYSIIGEARLTVKSGMTGVAAFFVAQRKPPACPGPAHLHREGGQGGSFYQDYPKKAASPYARKVLVKVGGRKDLPSEVTDVKFLEKADEKEFRE